MYSGQEIRSIGGRVSPRNVTFQASPPAAKRVRRTFSDIFLDKLKELAGDPPGVVNNGALRDALQWEEKRYNLIKKELCSKGLISRSRGGPGGSVGLVQANKQALKVFVSYSHADEKLKDALLKHLRPLERMKIISSWNDRRLLAGDTWDKEIDRNLEEADLVLFLVSIDFINSAYCYDIELKRALERHSRDGCKVVPIILRGCLWKHTDFGKLQALPRDGKPVTSWSDVDDALTNVAEGILRLANELLSSDYPTK